MEALRLKSQPQRELKDARVQSGGYLPVRPGPYAGVHIAEACVIEDVEELAAELKFGEFPNREGFVECPVPDVL